MPESIIPTLMQQLASGQLTARSLAEQYLQRIAEIDQKGPRLRSVIEVNPDALAIADALDAERRQRDGRGPLHGIPILIKDNIDTGDRMLTTAGSLAIEGMPAPRDATVAARLRAAGALILGKTNLSEWANFRSNRSTSGWSSRGGQTRNPYALDRNPCGSSSGSAVAVAAGLCVAAVGTETDGSIVCPAHMNGIVGLKPTVGLVSRAGIVPIAHSQDTAGPMARTVMDVAILLDVMAGPDPRDPYTQPTSGALAGGYAAVPVATAARGARPLQGLRLGIARNFCGFHPQVDQIFERCVAILRELGAEAVDPANVTTPHELDEGELTVLQYEFKADLDAYLEGRGGTTRVHSLAEVIAFNEEHRDHVMPYFGQEMMLASQERGPLTDPAYQTALANNLRLAREEGIDAALARDRLDVIVAPSGGPAWLTDYVNGDHYGGSSSSLAAVAGYPNITVPAGAVYGLPVGISFFSGAYQEALLLRVAYAFEQATQVATEPQFLATVQIPAI